MSTRSAGTKAQASGAADPITAEIARLSELPLADLRIEWRKLRHSPPPQVSRDLLLRAIIFDVQNGHTNGLPEVVVKDLRAIAAGNKPARVRAAPGARLVREWKGVAHIVTVTADGRYFWNGETHRTLSKIARTITGSNWSGNKFFGVAAS